MKKLLSLLVASVMVLGMVTTMYALPQNTAKAADVTKDVTMIVNGWNRCGFDRYGRPLYDGKFTQYSGVTVNADGTFAPTTQYPTYDATSGVFVPWQSEGEVIWGRIGFLMPNAAYAIRNDGSGRYNRPVNNTSPANWTTTPYLYTEVWLTVKASGGESQLYDHRYIIMDHLGQVWIDPDGKYNDCRYWDPANPASGYYRSSTILSGDNSAQWNDCFTNPKMLVDPSGDNNTQGPYIFNPQYNKTAPIQALPAPNYHERTYFWWYDEGKGIDRVWRLGWANMNDYLRRDGICADGVHTSSGIVGNFPGAYYPGKPVLWNSMITDPVSRRWTPSDQNIIANDWDAGLNLAGFSATEKYIDVNGDNNWQYGEPIFLDPDNNGFEVGDTRLVSYTIQWGGRAFNFREQTDVGPTDEDLQWYVARGLASLTFPANIMHGSIPGKSLYGQVYQNNDGDNFVSPGDYRLTNINSRYTGFGMTSGGFFQGDAIIMLELLYTTCSEKYNVHVQSDLWMIMQKDTLQNPEMAPSRTAAAFYSANGDINSMAQLINKATALDVDGKTFYVPTTTFFDVQLQYREYLGLQLFLDNGVDNNIAEGGKCYALSLSDDHVNFEAGEQFVGSKKVEKAMDIDLPMTQFPDIYLYNELNYNMTPGQFPTPLPADLRYGCGETIYKDMNRTPLNPAQALQPDPALINYNPGVVNVGDQRMMDITISPATSTGDAATVVTYKAGSFVTDGDLDVGRPLIKLENGAAFYDEPHDCAKPNMMYDVGELVYYDPALAGGTRSIRMIGWQNPADNGIERFEPATWTNIGTMPNPMEVNPFAGIDGSNWINVQTGYLAWSGTTQWINGIYIGNPPGYQPYSAANRTCYTRENYGGSWQLTAFPPAFNYVWPPSPQNPYPYTMNGGVLYYNGMDGDNPPSPATGPSWNKYVFDFDYTWRNYQFYASYYRFMGLAACYMQSNNTGYAAVMFYSPYGYSYYGWHRTSNYARLHILRYDNAGGWANVYPIQYFDPINNGSIIPMNSRQRIRTTVMSNIWTLTIPGWGGPVVTTLTGGNTYGSVGFPNGHFYSYYYYQHKSYWDNVEVYKIQKVPEPGDRIRLLSPGHYVGMNGFVLRKNDAAEVRTNSTNDMVFKPFGYFYPCGTKLAAGEVYDVESQVGMVTMGKCGDPRYMDIEVLPGKVKVNVDIDGVPANPNAAYHLKVEQTSDVKVSIDPAPKPGEKYIVKVTDVYQSGIPATPARVDYIESFENNTFTAFDKGQVELPKETFNTTYRLYYTYSDCASAQQSDYLRLPWDFPFYYETAAAGTKIEVSWAGWITFMGLPQVGVCKYAGTYGYPDDTYGWMRNAYNWAICACSFFMDLGWSPLGTYGQPNPNLGVWLSWPTTSEFKIRWAGHSYYAGDNDPATVNFSITIDREGNIRFSYGEMNSQDYALQWYNATVGISGYRSQDNTQYKNTSYHGSPIVALDYVDDLILTRTELPPDPGRPAGGPIDDDYPVGTVGGMPTFDGYNKTTKISDAVGNSFQKVVEITPENPVQHVQITPYRGSCNPDGSRDPLKVEVFLEKGGVSYKVPTDSILAGERQERTLQDYENLYDVNIYDPYWVARPWTIRQYDSRHKGDRTPRPIESPSGIPTFTCGLANNYDCYGVFKMYVEPETLNLVPNRCLSPVDMRFPNLFIKVTDADNPRDVNDPANIDVSTAGVQTGGRAKLIANVNAHGAGIQYLCTAINPTYGHMYIIQVNTDGTYLFWRLYEPRGDSIESKARALDPTDWLYSMRNNGVDINGQGGPTRMPFKDTDGFLQGSIGSTLTTSLDDRDCSVGKGICDVCPLGDGFPPLGDISYNDRMGRFNNQAIDYQAPFMNGFRGYTFGVINTYGVPCLISNWTDTSAGGEICVPIQPQNSETDVQIRVYLDNTIFDYNSSLATTSMDTSNPTIHPPYFAYDDAPGIDYCGVTTVKVMPAAKLNFSEFRWVDNGLRFSEANYTSGTRATSPLDRPSPQLQHWYDPICWNNKRDTYCYPGGQSHVARAVGNTRGGGFNAYPAINQNMWRKLGTEFYPLTDYSLYFVLNSPTDTNRTQEWDQYTLDASIAQNQPELSFLIIRSIEVKGPFMTPMRWFRPEQTWEGSTYARQRLTSEYNYNGIKNVPIRYDTSGYIKADYQNWQTYEYTPWMWSTGDFTSIIDPAPDFQLDTHQALGIRLPRNRVLVNHKDLIYVNQQPYLPFQAFAPNAGHVFVFDGIIPTQPGNIEIKVTLANGDVKIYQDCCQVPPTDGIDVHALKIKLQNEDIEQRGGVFVNTPVTFKVNLYENEKVDPSNNQEWANPECNDALVFAWQDRGCWDPDQNVWAGAGDGWLSNPPKNSTVYAQGVQYQPGDDKNRDGKVSFKDGETEIIGTYDITTNSWSGAYIDARTFQRNNGEYMLECGKDMITSVGFDFGSMTPTGKPVPGGVKDHVIGWDETLPIWIVGYKYGDDNNDRSFRPLFDVLPDNTPSMSHEVYISGTRAFEVLPNVDLQMTYGPEPLTAGMQPELQAPDKPLTFTFTDAQGNPVDFSRGVTDGFGQSYVEDRNIEMHCFVDPHPDDEYYYGKGAHLPQYYWLRTDLHNYSGGIVCNAFLYSTPSDPFTPIKFQVKRDDKNRAVGYSFLGFCANDQGEFDVYAYTPDRKHSGKVTVKVAQPHVEYKIRNTETNQMFSVTGNPSASAKSEDPDFVMTAYDERIYEITVKCTDAQGQPIRGVAKEVSVCSGSGQDTARFTPFVTRPKEWEWAYGTNAGGGPTHPGTVNYGVYYDFTTWNQVYWMMASGNRFSPWIAIDINNDGKIDPILNKNNEIHRLDAMGAFQNASWINNFDMSAVFYEHYNTTNFRFDDLRFDTRRAHDLPPTANRGWGLGAIYNNPYFGGYLFCDLNSDNYLSYSDSLSFNQNGEISFFYYADDKMNVGGLVGNNIYSNSGDFGDVYGNPQWYAQLDPNKVHTRFRHGKNQWGGSWWGTNDGSFRLDWEAIPDNMVKVEAPIVKLYDPATGEEASKDLLDPEYYDATYGKLNHFIVRAYPADPRDNKIKEESYVLTSNDRAYLPQGITSQHERLTLGRLHNSEVDPKAVETMISWRPTGTGKDVTALLYARNINWNLRTNSIVTNPTMENIFFIADSIRIDSCKGLDVKAEPLNKILRLGQLDTVIVTVTEAGSGYRMEGVKVVLKSEDGTINLEQKTDANGEATFANVKPESLSKIVAKATMEGKVTGYAELFVDIDLTPPSINIDAFPGITNKTSITLTGDVTKGSTLKLNTVNAEVDATGKWKATYNLVSGENIITLVATGPNGAIRTTTIRIVLDKDPPKLIMPTQEQIDNYIVENEGKLKLSGRVDPGSDVTISVQQAGGNKINLGVTVVNDYWQTTEFTPVAGVPLDVIVTAKDAAENTTPASTATFKMLKVNTLKLVVGNTQKVFNGKADLLTQPPLLDKATGTPMVPAEELSNELGYTATFANNKLTITIDKYTADFTVGSTTATLNGNTVTLTVAPVIATGKVLIPASFITKVLDMDTTSVNTLTYEPQGKVITIKRIWGK